MKIKYVAILCLVMPLHWLIALSVFSAKKPFQIGHNFWMVCLRAFKFHMCIPYGETSLWYQCQGHLSMSKSHFSVFQTQLNYTPYKEVEGGILESPWLSVCPSSLWTQFCAELFSYSFARTALKFIHNVCVYMKLCICNFHVRLSVRGHNFVWSYSY